MRIRTTLKVTRGIAIAAVFAVGILCAAIPAQAGTVVIDQSAFSGTETVITFSEVVNGNPIEIQGVSFQNNASGNLMSGLGFDRAIYFGKESDDGQLIDLIGQSDFTMVFPDVVNRVGMEFATGGTEGNTVSWFFQAFDTDDNLLGDGSASGIISNLQNGTFIPNPFYATGSVFMGFESSEGIAKVRVYQTSNDANITIMDNLRFEAVSNVVPLPAAVWAGMVMLGGMGGVRAWKRRRAAA